MAREIIITEVNNTEGIKEVNLITLTYSYKEKKYYIENKGYITERINAEDVFNTIQAITSNITEDTITSNITHIYSPLLNIDEDTNTLPLSYIEALSTTYEHLTEDNMIPLYFTWSDNGSYIASIQISTYYEDSIILNAEKGKLYIYNTDIIFDLTLNESDNIRIGYIRDYFYNTVGVDLPYIFFGCIYNTLLSYYNPFKYNNIGKTITSPSYYHGIPSTKPYPYNIIDTNTIDTEDTSSIMYSNIYSLPDFTTNNPIAYTCAENPNNTVIDKTHLNYIASLEGNIITLTNTVNSAIQVGSVLQLSDTTTVIDGSTYTSDGTYTITGIDTDNNTLTIDTNFPYNYTYNPPILAIRGYQQNIASLNRGTREITLTNTVYNAYQIGDIIQIHGSYITGDYGEVISADGSYTISSVGVNATGENAPNVIIVEEDIPISTGSIGFIYKDIKAGNIKEVNTTECKVLLQESSIYNLNSYENYAIIYVDEDLRVCIQRDTDENKTSTNSTLYYIQTAELTKDITYTYGSINQPVYSQETQVNIENSINTIIMPTGLFMVDNRVEVENYIKLLSEANTEIVKAIPNTEIYSYLYKPVETKEIYFYYPTEDALHPEVNKRILNFKGVYSKMYKTN